MPTLTSISTASTPRILSNNRLPIGQRTCEHCDSSFAHGATGCCCSGSFLLFELSAAVAAGLSAPWSAPKHQNLTNSIPKPLQTLGPETPAYPAPFCAAAAASSDGPALLTGSAGAESSSALPGADAVGDAGASAWSGPWFRSVSRRVKSGGGDAGFFDPRGGGALTLGRFGAGTDEEDGDGDGRFPAAAAAELRRVSTMACAGGEGFLSARLRFRFFSTPQARGILSAFEGDFFFLLWKWFC